MVFSDKLVYRLLCAVVDGELTALEAHEILWFAVRLLGRQRMFGEKCEEEEASDERSR